MDIASLSVSIVAFVVGVVGLLPLFGILEWLAIILSVLGFTFGFIPIVKKMSTPAGIAGFIISSIVIVMAMLRLAAGGWFG